MKNNFKRKIFQIIVLVNSICLFGQTPKDDLSKQTITVELLIVEYNHENGFNWGIDILNAQKNKKINRANLDSNNKNNISFNSLVDSSITSSLDEMFQINLQALVQDNIAKITQNPRITVTQGNQAIIDIKETKYIQLQTASNNGLTTDLTKIDAGINLTISPTIITKSNIHLEVKGEVSEFQETSLINANYSIESKSIDTQVYINHGQSLIIGGLIKEQDFNLESGPPFLRKIPLLGKIFSRVEKITSYKEIVIYITVYIGDVDQEESENQSKELRNAINLMKETTKTSP